MENETEIENKPVDNEEVLELDFNDVEDESPIVEDTTKPVETEVDTPVENADKEVDFSPLLSELSKKIKYKDEAITIDNLDDVIENYQKGKNYGTLQDKLDAIANSKQMKLIEKLAKESNMSVDDYVDFVEKTQEQNKIDEMIAEGMTEAAAKKVLNAERIEREIREKTQREEQEKQKRLEQEKQEADSNEFLTAFPDVNIKDIPKEVFINAKNSSLKSAYTEHLLKEAQRKIQELETKTKAPIRGVQGGTEIDKTDDFLKGLGL